MGELEEARKIDPETEAQLKAKKEELYTIRGFVTSATKELWASKTRNAEANSSVLVEGTTFDTVEQRAKAAAKVVAKVKTDTKFLSQTVEKSIGGGDAYETEAALDQIATDTRFVVEDKAAAEAEDEDDAAARMDESSTGSSQAEAPKEVAPVTSSAEK